ncbi:hypothetical protein CSG_6040 [Campylobacter fetus subsp. venerealis str. 84-112]|nr:hypothetical protein CSG_6040 [Campylobacter fetus subsp. venerealis str. 84-112]
MVKLKKYHIIVKLPLFIRLMLKKGIVRFGVFLLPYFAYLAGI